MEAIRTTWSNTSCAKRRSQARRLGFRSPRTFLYAAILFLIFSTGESLAQGVGISESSITPNANAILELRSTLRGFLAPRLTTAERTTLGAIPPAQGMLVYDTQDKKFYYWDNATWNAIAAGASVGTVTNVATGSGLTGGPVTATGTIALANGIAAGQVYVTGATPFTPALATMSGDATISSAGALTIANNAVTYGKMQPVSATNKLLGSSASTTAVQELTLGSGLSLAGTTLSSTGTGGTVTTFSAGTLSPLFTTSVATATSTPALTFSISNAGAYSILGNNTNASAAPTYFTPTLASALFSNQGTTATVLHGNAAGNPSWGAVSLAADVSGTLQATNFPALTGDVTNTAGSLGTTIANNAVTYGKMQAVSATNKLLGSSSTTTPVQEITLGSGLSLAGTTLSSTGTGGTVTTFSAGTLGPLFTTSVATATSTPALSFTLSNAGANTLLGNNTGASAAPAYFTPTLASALFSNQGTTATVLHGNAAGNPSWGAVSLAADVSGTLQATNFPALTGDVTNTAGSLGTTIANNAVTYGKMQAVSATNKLLGSSSTTTPVQEITLGGGLSLAGTTLSATGTGGTVTSFSAGTLSPLFTTSVATATSTPALSFTLTNAGAYTLFGNNTNAAAGPAYFTPTLASALFQNQGTTATVLHGNAAGNPSWGAVSLTADVTGTLQATNFPALTGDVTTTAGSLATTIANNAVAYGKMQAVSTTSKLLGSSSTTTPVQEITLGSGLSIAGTTLSATATGFANPSASLGLTAINGVATTAMRSDAAPALDVSILPTWTGAHTWSALGTFNLGLSASGAGVNLNASSNFATNINTGTSTGTVSIGGTTGAAGIVQRVGTGNFSLDGVAGSTYTIGASTTTGTTTIGGTAQSGAITVGSSSAAQTLNLATGAGSATVNVANGLAGSAVSIANGANTSPQTVNIGAGANAANNTINIGSGTNTAGVVAVNVGTNTNFANTTLIKGGNAAGAITMTPQTTGTIVIGAPAGTGAITVGSSSAAQTLNLGTGVGAATVNVANGLAGSAVSIANGANTSAQTINIGAGANAANNTINIGSGLNTAGVTAISIGSNQNLANTTLIEAGNGAGAITLDPQSAGGIVIGDATGTGNITLGSSTAAQSVLIGNGVNAAVQVVSIANGNTAANTTVNILAGAGTAGTGAVNIGDNPRVTTIDLGNATPAAARTTTIAGATSAVVDQVNIGTGAATVVGGKTINIGTTAPTGAGTNVIQIGAASLTNGNGVRFGNPRIVTNHPTAPAVGGAVTLTATQVLDAGIYVLNATAIITFPSAASMVALMPSPQVGDVITFEICMSGNVAPTIAQGAGGTLVSRGTSPNASTRIVSIRFTNVTAGTEAYSLY